MTEILCSNCKLSLDTEPVVCKLCLCSYCYMCCGQEEKLYSEDEIALICVGCSALVAQIETLLLEDNVSWGTLSSRGQRWLATCNIEVFRNSYSETLENYISMPITEEDEHMIENDVSSGRSDPGVFNWEIRETLCRVSNSTYRSCISRVLRAFCARNYNIGYCQGLNYVTTWLLLFMDEENAFWTLCFLIEKWLLPDFYIGSKRGNSLNGFYIESSVIAGLITHLIPSMLSHTMPASEFADLFSLQLLIQLFVNTVDLAATTFLWDRLMSEGSIALIRGTVSLIAISEKAIMKNDHPLIILKKLSENRIAPSLKMMYESLVAEITERRVSRLRSQARDYRAKQWKGKMTVKRLAKFSQFTNSEIEDLQTEFNNFLQHKRRQRGNTVTNSTRRKTVYLPPHMNDQIKHTEGDVDIGITKEEFLEFIAEVNPSMVELAKSSFEQFDEDKSGYLDFRELMMCINLLSRGSFDEKLRVCFNAYDFDKSGYLDIDDVNLLLENMLQPYIKELEQNFDEQLNLKISQICKTVVCLVEVCDGKLNFNDFRNTVRANPELYACFCQHVESGDLEINTFTDAIRTASFITDRRVSSSCYTCQLL